MNGHDGEELVYGPRVGKRLEEREVAEVAVYEHAVDLGEDVLVLLGILGRQHRHAVHDGQPVALGLRALPQRHGAAGEVRLHLLLDRGDARFRRALRLQQGLLTRFRNLPFVLLLEGGELLVERASQLRLQIVKGHRG